MSRRVFYCGKCFTLLDSPNEECPVCGKNIDVRSVIKNGSELNELAEEVYDFLNKEEGKLYLVSKILEEILDSRDKFIQKIENLLENEEE